MEESEQNSTNQPVENTDVEFIEDEEVMFESLTLHAEPEEQQDDKAWTWTKYYKPTRREYRCWVYWGRRAKAQTTNLTVPKAQQDDPLEYSNAEGQLENRSILNVCYNEAEYSTHVRIQANSSQQKINTIRIFTDVSNRASSTLSKEMRYLALEKVVFTYR